MKANPNIRHTNNNAIYLLIGLFIFALLFSCKDQSRYRVRMLERNTIALLVVDHPNVYQVGDTIWLNTTTNRVDNASDSTMMCVIEKQID